MDRAAATIVILAWNAWSATEACLASLRRTLRDDDQVVVVDNGSVDETPSELPGYDWIELHTNPENRGFAAGCNQGASHARNPVVVFLNSDTVVSAGWLDGLLEPFAAPDVAATGPRSNFVSGIQLIDTAYEVGDARAVDDFAWLWRLHHRGGRTETSRLVGFCLAVRTATFLRLGGFDEGFGLGGCEDDDLCFRLAADGGRLLVCDDVFVHHDGHASFDDNEVDWAAIERANHQRLWQKTQRPALPFPEPLPAREPLLDDPRVSVLVPTHNRPALLRRALQSIAEQTYGDFEVVVVNDGGLDVTDVVETVRERLSVQLVSLSVNGGRAAALTTAVVAARGELLAFLDDDDTYFPHHLSTLVDAYDRTAPTASGPVGVHSFCIRVLHRDGAVERSVVGDKAFDPDALSVQNSIVGMTPLVPADAVREAGGFDDRMRVLEDWELWLRLSRSGLTFSSIPVPTAEYHWHESNQTVRERIRFNECVRHVYAQHPVPGGSREAALRRHFHAVNSSRDTDYAFDVSVVVAGGGDVASLVATLQSAAAVLAGGRWELVLFLPDPAVYAVLLAQLGGDFQAYGVGDATVDEVWQRAAERTAGRHVLRVIEGQTLDASAVLSALGRSGATVTDAGAERPTPLVPSVPAPRVRLADAR